MYKKVLILIFNCLLAVASVAQSAKPKLIQIIKTGSLSYDKDVINAKVLRGDVICEHEGALLYCDTAYIFEQENKMTARGHILITKGDSIRVTGETLIYDGKSRMATLSGNVKCVEKDMTLTTSLLTFDVAHSVANYYNGGTLVNKENTLVSKNGHYYSATKEASFHYNVVLTNPDYKMNSDTLRYRIPNKTSYFFGPSIITSKTDYIYCENGWYDTEKEKSQFSKNAILVTKQQKLRGDSLTYDRINQTGKAYRNVTLIDTSQKSIIYGNYIEYHQKNSEALVTKKAVYARLMDKDTLFIRADTLYYRNLDSVNYFLNAFHHVQLFKPDLQALCDSASLNSKDSLLKLFRSPVLWSQHSQATSKLIKVKIVNSSIQGFELDGQAFFIQAVDTVNMKLFNQLTARKMTAFMTEDTIRKVIADGNAEIYYYPKNGKKIMGLNKTKGSEIVSWFKKGDVARVSMRPNTSGTVDPIKDVDSQNATLKGFNWLYNKRPKSSRDLFR